MNVQKVLEKCQLQEAIRQKDEGLNAKGKGKKRVSKRCTFLGFRKLKMPITVCSCARWIELERGTEATILSWTCIAETQQDISS
jgi:hypothetical protein